MLPATGAVAALESAPRVVLRAPHRLGERIAVREARGEGRGERAARAVVAPGQARPAVLALDAGGAVQYVHHLIPGLVRTGDQAKSDAVYRGANPMTAEDIAATLLWVATLPPHLNINALELMPVSQSFAGFAVAREGQA